MNCFELDGFMMFLKPKGDDVLVKVLQGAAYYEKILSARHLPDLHAVTSIVAETTSVKLVTPDATYSVPQTHREKLETMIMKQNETLATQAALIADLQAKVAALSSKCSQYAHVTERDPSSPYIFPQSITFNHVDINNSGFEHVVEAEYKKSDDDTWWTVTITKGHLAKSIMAKRVRFWTATALEWYTCNAANPIYFSNYNR